MAEGPRPRLRPAWGATCALVLLGWLVMVLAGRLLIGGLIIAAGLVVAASARAALPNERAGGIHIRSRTADIVMHVVFAAAVAIATILVFLREGI